MLQPQERERAVVTTTTATTEEEHGDTPPRRNEEDIPKKKKIKHLVVSGGGLYGLSALAALTLLSEEQFWCMDEIESIHGTSVGAIIAVLVALKFDLDMLREYMLNQHWNVIFKLNLAQLMQTSNHQGLFHQNMLRDLLRPLFLTKSISPEITMRELFDATNVDVHIFTVDLYCFRLVDVNHATHPSWKVMDAMYASSAIPVVFNPLYRDGSCFVDGALLCNYPLEACMAAGDKDPREILAIVKKKTFLEEMQSSFLNEHSSFLTFLIFLICKLFFYKPTAALLAPASPAAAAAAATSSLDAVHEIEIEDKLTSLDYIHRFVNCMEERVSLIQLGRDRARAFLDGEFAMRNPNGL